MNDDLLLHDVFGLVADFSLHLRRGFDGDRVLLELHGVLHLLQFGVFFLAVGQTLLRSCVFVDYVVVVCPVVGVFVPALSREVVPVIPVVVEGSVFVVFGVDAVLVPIVGRIGLAVAGLVAVSVGAVVVDLAVHGSQALKTIKMRVLADAVLASGRGGRGPARRRFGRRRRPQCRRCFRTVSSMPCDSCYF